MEICGECKREYDNGYELWKHLWSTGHVDTNDVHLSLRFPFIKKGKKTQESCPDCNKKYDTEYELWIHLESTGHRSRLTAPETKE